MLIKQSAQLCDLLTGELAHGINSSGSLLRSNDNNIFVIYKLYANIVPNWWVYTQSKT